MARADELLATRQAATYAVPAFPVVYVKTFGRFGDGYALARTIYVFPVWGSARLMLFDAEGTPAADTGVRQVSIPFVVSYARQTDLAASKLLRWRVGVLNLPVLGTFVGFGTGYFKLMFIEFGGRSGRQAPTGTGNAPGCPNPPPARSR